MTLRDLRQQKKLTQEQMAEMLGISRITVARMEAGKASMTLHVLEGLMREFEMTYDEVKALEMKRKT